jgi:molybdopterin/thiamine biosynthesis adenylyltransferase
MHALSDADRARYAWQLSVADFGEAGQLKLKNASVLISRCGGVGGTVAYQLAAAGIGRILLAHAGNLEPADLNRQLLMNEAGVGSARVEQAAQRLRAFNPSIEIVPVNENITEANVDPLLARVDMVASCAPRFGERLLMNRAAVRQGKPLVDCAMFELEAQLTSVIPGRTPCLACIYPEEPPAWNRRFPVFGAVAGVVASLGAMEVIKILTGVGEPLAGQMLMCDLRDMSFRKGRLQRDPRCPVCAS